jgi:hypothetical protein
MAPIKFEEDIKVKLESRRIEPSAESWQKLAGKLDDQRQASRKRYWWVAVAASLILVLFTVLQVTQSPEDMLPQEQYSVEEAPVKEGSADESIIKEKQTLPQSATEEMFAEEEAIQKLDETIMTKKEKPAIPTVKTEETFAEVSQPRIEKDLPVVADKIEVAEATQDIDELLIKEAIKELNGNSEKSIDKEADSLLKAAQKALLLDKNMRNNTSVVDASKLLMEAELEAEPSIKAKVYDAIKDGFKKVKTAVAQRKN